MTLLETRLQLGLHSDVRRQSSLNKTQRIESHNMPVPNSRSENWVLRAWSPMFFLSLTNS